MDILIKNASLISMEEQREKIEEDIDILIRNKKIEQIDRNIEAKVDKVIDASRKSCNAGAH